MSYSNSHGTQHHLGHQPQRVSSLRTVQPLDGAALSQSTATTGAEAKGVYRRQNHHYHNQQQQQQAQRSGLTSAFAASASDTTTGRFAPANGHAGAQTPASSSYSPALVDATLGTSPVSLTNDLSFPRSFALASGAYGMANTLPTAVRPWPPDSESRLPSLPDTPSSYAFSSATPHSPSSAPRSVSSGIYASASTAAPATVHTPRHGKLQLRRWRASARSALFRMRSFLRRLWHRPSSPGRRLLHMCLAACTLVLLLLLAVRHVRRWWRSVFLLTEAQLTEAVGPPEEPWSVLVQHDGAAARLNLSHMRELVETGCAQEGRQEVCSDRLVLAPSMLPSWTLHVVNATCVECVDAHTYAAAAQQASVTRPFAVFATPAAPLGRIGPMLYAMSSVTTDVPLREELPRWRWLRHVSSGGRPTRSDDTPTGAALRPYLAVMGIPSTDQPARVALRTAQRRTWMSYSEVARSENGFEGALLPLYIFAAKEAAVGRGDAANARPSGCGDVSSLLPTPEEFNVASRVLARVDRDGPVTAVTRHYVRLRQGWKVTPEEGGGGEAAEDGDSPCGETISVHDPNSLHPPVVAALQGQLRLPVMPAFVSPARYVCCASSPLWREALVWRDFLWVDMVTDRRSTTGKRIGEDGGWGMPVEVGLTQKVLLWLSYAYDAFPTVPFILKADDDVYVKVPQYLSDLRYLQSGARHRRVVGVVSTGKNDNGDDKERDVRTLPAAAVADNGTIDLLTPDETECLYWGSLRHHEHTQFNAGMLYLMHRRVVQALLEPPNSSDTLNIVQLAAEGYREERAAAYKHLYYDHEDIFVALRIYDRLTRIKELCPNGRLWYGKEWYARFHDLHVGRQHNVTWSTVVAHRCRPADSYFLHHFFQTEYAFMTMMREAMESAEREARREAVRWIAEQLQRGRDEAEGWEKLPAVRWARDLSKVPKFELAAHDGVAVYSVPYEYWTHGPTTIEDGYRSQPQW